MLRTLLIATALLTTSGAALARDGHDYGHVISVEPSFSISFGVRQHDGFRVQYESGGHSYWTHASHYPDHYFVRPPQHYVRSGYGYPDPGWNGRKRHHWKGYRQDRRDDRRDYREHRHHDWD